MECNIYSSQLLTKTQLQLRREEFFHIAKETVKEELNKVVGFLMAPFFIFFAIFLFFLYKIIKNEYLEFISKNNDAFFFKSVNDLNSFLRENNVSIELENDFINKNLGETIFIQGEIALHIEKKNNIYKSRIYKNVAILGAGQYGTVTKIKNILSNKEFAIKIHFSFEEYKKEVNTYNYINSNIKCKNHIGQSYYTREIKTDEDKKGDSIPCLLLDSYKKSYLKEIIDKKLSLESLDFFISQSLQILKELEQAKIIHSDWHLENILVDGEKLRIIDFGCAKKFSESENSLKNIEDIKQFLSCVVFYIVCINGNENFRKSIDEKTNLSYCNDTFTRIKNNLIGSINILKEEVEKINVINREVIALNNVLRFIKETLNLLENESCTDDKLRERVVLDKICQLWDKEKQ